MRAWPGCSPTRESRSRQGLSSDHAGSLLSHHSVRGMLRQLICFAIARTLLAWRLLITVTSRLPTPIVTVVVGMPPASSLDAGSVYSQAPSPIPDSCLNGALRPLALAFAVVSRPSVSKG